MRIGVDYYPEHWEKSRWETDLQLMDKCGIQVVRIGEFDWSLYEPKEGEYHFEWMDEILSFMQEHNMKVILGTPSATPPKWMCDKYGDELYQKDQEGHSKIFGTRKHYCFNSDVYRKETSLLVEKIASRYGKHPAVEGWQIDNELGWANTTRCYCEKCRKKFQSYLQNKYKEIDTLNQKYGTVFWSETYNDFSQINVPLKGVCFASDPNGTQGQNPSLVEDFDRFSSDSVISFTKNQVDIIRKYSSLPITTNMLDANINSGTGIDYFKLSKLLDYASWDNYINFQWGIADNSIVSRDHALIRSYKHKSFTVMEQQAGAIGWSVLGSVPTPGQLRLWVYSSIANGADTVVMFRWRSCLFGTEEYWNGILGHDGKVNRRYNEFSKVGSELKKLSDKFGNFVPKAQVAIVKSFDSEWSHAVHSHVEGFQYDKLLLDYYKGFYANGISVDFVSPEEDLSGYRIVLAPALIMVNEEQKLNLETYVKNGGNLLLSFRSGIKSMENTMLPMTAPGVFSNLSGVEVNDYDPQYQKSTTTASVFGTSTSNLWCDIVEPNDETDVLGVYTSDYYSDKACFTAHAFGKGITYYLGCDLDESAMKKMAIYLADKCGVTRVKNPQEGVEIIDATDGKNDVRFVLNHNSHSVVVDTLGEYTDILDEKTKHNQLFLKPYDVAILKEK